MTYRNHTIGLFQTTDYNSMTGQNVKVWVWQTTIGTTIGKGQHIDKNQAILRAKQFIDKIIDDPDMNNVF